MFPRDFTTPRYWLASLHPDDSGISLSKKIIRNLFFFDANILTSAFLPVPGFRPGFSKKKSSGYFLFVKKAVVWVIWMCRWDKLNLSLAPAFFQATTYLRLLRLLAKIQEKQQETRGNRRKRRKQEEREETGGSRGKRRKRRKQEKSARMTIWLSNPHAALRFQTKTRNTLKGRIKKCNSKQNYKLKDIAETIWGEIALKSTN